MGLADAINSLSPSSRNSKFCAYQTLLNSLNKEDIKALDDAREKGYATHIIITALRAEGHKISRESMNLHYIGKCRCPKN
jgi:hypothetical protein